MLEVAFMATFVAALICASWLEIMGEVSLEDVVSFRGGIAEERDRNENPNLIVPF